MFDRREDKSCGQDCYWAVECVGMFETYSHGEAQTG